MGHCSCLKKVTKITLDAARTGTTSNLTNVRQRLNAIPTDLAAAGSSRPITSLMGGLRRANAKPGFGMQIDAAGESV
jgi:hypothetical protein